MSSPTSPSSSGTWSASERATVDALIDTLLPPSADGRLPPPSQLAIAAVLARKAAQLPELAAQLTRCLTKLDELARARNARFAELAPNARTELVQALATEEPVTFLAVQRQTFIAYYMHDSVPELFGFPNRPPQPLGHEQPENELEALLAPVRARGPRYRDT